MYKIGEFSKITNLSIKALRLYHKKGILLPSHIDEHTGYRHYGQQDIDKARAISHLKHMAFSLSEIALIMETYEDEYELIDFLQEKQKHILAQTKKLKLISKSIHRIIKQETEINKMSQTHYFNIEEKTITQQKVLTVRWKGRYEEVGKVFSKLYRTIGRHSNGTPFNLYYDAEYKQENADIETCVPVTKDIHAEDCQLKEIPEQKCLSLMHKGPYEEIGRSYQKLFDHIRNSDQETQLPIREVYIKGPGMILKGNPKNYMTEILVPIK